MNKKNREKLIDLDALIQKWVLHLHARFEYDDLKKFAVSVFRCPCGYLDWDCVDCYYKYNGLDDDSQGCKQSIAWDQLTGGIISLIKEAI